MAAKETLLRLELLEQVSIFKSLPAEILMTLAQNFYQIKLDTGESLIRQGDNDRNVYVLLDGTFDVFVTNSTSNQQHLHTVGKGAIFGDMAFFTGQPRSATIIAASRSTCYILKASDLRYLMYKYPIIAIEMGTALAHKLQETTTLVQG
jgi:CRP-like cAMP-binding protein